MKKIFILGLLLLSTMGLAQEKSEINTVFPTNLRGPVGISGACVPIPDNAFVDNDLTTMACVTVPGPGGTILDLNVEVSMTHTWAGDITTLVIAPDGTTLTLLDRPGRSGSGAGDSSDMAETAVFTFDDSSANNSENMGNTIVDNSIICQDDGICDYTASGSADDTPHGVNLADFNGMESAGNWMVCVGDSAGGDLGELCPGAGNTNLVFDIAPVVLAPPTPVPSLGLIGTTLLALAMLSLFFVYRRKV